MTIFMLVILCAIYILFGIFMSGYLLSSEEDWSVLMKVFILLFCVTLGPIVLLLGLVFTALISFLQLFDIFKSKY